MELENGLGDSGRNILIKFLGFYYLETWLELLIQPSPAVVLKTVGTL